MAEQQADCDVLIAPRALPGRPIGRLDHPPFRPPEAAEADFAAEASAWLDAPGTPVHLAPRAAHQAVVLAIRMRAPLLVSGQDTFRDLIPLSAWSMNVPSAPPDTVLVRTLSIAGDETARGAATDPGILKALLEGDDRRRTALVRDRRRAARALGPGLFRRIAPRSAGLRGFAVTLDLLPALAASPEARRWLAGLDPARALTLLASAPAVFI